MASTENTVAVTQVQQQETQETISLMQLFWLCVAQWKWFVVSVVVCLAMAAAYLIRKQPVYTRTASVLVKDEKGGTSSLAGVSDFSDFGMFAGVSNVNNELGIILSPDVMREVVKRLDLDVNYLKKGFLRNTTLYGDSLPVKVRFKSLVDSESAEFKLNLSGGNAVLSDFNLNGDDMDSGELTCAVGKTIDTPVGKIELVKGKSFGKTPEMEIKVSKTPLQLCVDGYAANFDATIEDKKATIIAMSIEDVSVQRAEDFLNMLISVYNESWVKDKNQLAVSTSMFINERLGVIEGELGHVDSDISSFKSANLLPDVQAAAELYMTQAQEAQKSVNELNSQAYMARYIKNYLTSDKNRFQLLPANSGIDDTALAQQIAEYNTKLLDRNSLVSQSSTENPLVVEMDAQLAGLRSALIHSVDNQIVSLNEQIRMQQGMGGTATSKIASNPSQSKYLLSVERQQKVKEALYLFLLQKREENELSQAFTAYNTRVVAMPGGSIKPTSPKKAQILLIALIIGLAIPAAVVYVRESNNTVIRGRKDLENMAMPFVGEIPLSTEKNGENIGPDKGRHAGVPALVVVNRDNGDIINDAFRVVRTNIEFMVQKDRKCHVLMMLSANPGSGKTFVCYNLAKSLAIKGKRVCAIDLDLRKASLSLYVKQPKKGMSNYLAGQVADYKTLIQKTDEENFDVLPVGTIPPNPAELLFSERLETMIAELRNTYDYVFIDCPPAEIVADADIINKHVDETLFIVRVGKLERAQLPIVDKYYTDNKYRKLSLILNGSLNGGHYGYKYGYGGYGYGYGYGHKYGYGQSAKK